MAPILRAPLQLWNGCAGSGKSTAAINELTAAGVPFAFLAPSGTLVREAAAKGARSFTYHKFFLQNVDNPWAPSPDFARSGFDALVCDEVYATDRKIIASCVDYARRTGCILILLGDPHQLPAIEPEDNAAPRACPREYLGSLGATPRTFTENRRALCPQLRALLVEMWGADDAAAVAALEKALPRTSFRQMLQDFDFAADRVAVSTRRQITRINAKILEAADAAGVADIPIVWRPTRSYERAQRVALPGGGSAELFKGDVVRVPIAAAKHLAEPWELWWACTSYRLQGSTIAAGRLYVCMDQIRLFANNAYVMASRVRRLDQLRRLGGSQ